jgi:hypothetical protein
VSQLGRDDGVGSIHPAPDLGKKNLVGQQFVVGDGIDDGQYELDRGVREGGERGRGVHASILAKLEQVF